MYIEYCEIHIDLSKSANEIIIFSKNGKDATKDREALHTYVLKTGLHRSLC